jgi:hypothetical protein
LGGVLTRLDSVGVEIRALDVLCVFKLGRVSKMKGTKREYVLVSKT